MVLIPWIIVCIEVEIRPRARSDHPTHVIQIVGMGFWRNIWRETPGFAVSRHICPRDGSDWCVHDPFFGSRGGFHLNIETASGLPRNRLLIHGFLTVLVPYIHARLRNNAMSNAWPEAPSSDRRRKLWEWMSTIESTHAALSLISFVIFLWNGRYACIHLHGHQHLLTFLYCVGTEHLPIGCSKCNLHRLVG